MVRQFWWGQREDKRKVHWKKWSSMCKPKSEGGLGFRDMRAFNMAMLAKQGWRLLKNPETLSARVLKARYFPTTSFLHAAVGTNPSYVWRSIWAAKPLLYDGLRWRVGNGESINIRQDKWIPRPHSFKCIAPPMHLPAEATVAGLIGREFGGWNFEFIMSNFSPIDAEEICNIPLCPRPVPDVLIWHYERNGVFSVRSAYHLEMSIRDRAMTAGPSSVSPELQSLWSAIWALQTPPKVRIFMWKVCHEIIPVRRNLKRRQIVDNICFKCPEDGESVMHCLQECVVAWNAWLTTPVGSIVTARRYANAQQWMLAMSQQPDHKAFALFAFMCWVIWNNRNGDIFGGIVRYQAEIYRYAANYLAEFNTALAVSDGRQAIQRHQGGSHWVPPRSGNYKVNFDAVLSTWLYRLGNGSP